MQSQPPGNVDPLAGSLLVAIERAILTLHPKAPASRILRLALRSYQLVTGTGSVL